MNNIIIVIIIGLIAGIVDVIPMIIKKIEKASCISAFLHYFALGIIIPFVNWNMSSCLKGAIIALITAIPIMIISYPKDKKALIPMTIFAIILGIGIGYFGNIFVII